MEIAANIDLEQGIEVSAAEVRDWVSGHRNVDIHQRLVDKTSGQSRLKDSGLIENEFSLTFKNVSLNETKKIEDLSPGLLSKSESLSFWE